jgi:hypothetical protein
MVACVGLATAALVAQMPDVSQMSGVPLPTSDLPAGTVAIRVVRGDLSNNVVGQAVELHAGAQQWNATTDESGRATFSGLPAGTRVHGIATVDGQRLETQEFPVPAAGGRRSNIHMPPQVISAPPATSASISGLPGASPASSTGVEPKSNGFRHVLEFEKPLRRMEEQIAELEAMQKTKGIDLLRFLP